MYGEGPLGKDRRLPKRKSANGAYTGSRRAERRRRGFVRRGKSEKNERRGGHLSNANAGLKKNEGGDRNDRPDRYR